MKNLAKLDSYLVLLQSSTIALALAVACQDSEQASSSTNWLGCDSDVDCAVVPGATCRSDSVCVDPEGHPVPDTVAAGKDQSGGGHDHAGTAGDEARGDSAGGGVLPARALADAGDSGADSEPHWGGSTAGAKATTLGGSAGASTGAGAAASGAGAAASGAGAGGAGPSSKGGSFGEPSRAGAGGVSLGAAGEGPTGTCPLAPPIAATSCPREGLVCEYAGSSVGMVARCSEDGWVVQSEPGDPNYACPPAAPEQGEPCPTPPTPAFSPLVCLFDCDDASCQGSGASCGASQADCSEVGVGEWQWVYRESSYQCAEAACDSQSSASRWSAPALSKECEDASDCFLGRHTFDCCGSVRTIAYTTTEAEAFEAYETVCASRVTCACAATLELEDGTPIAKGTPETSCIEGVCHATCPGSGCQFTADCSGSDECLLEGICTWINPLSGSNLCRQPDGTCGGC